MSGRSRENCISEDEEEEEEAEEETVPYGDFRFSTGDMAHHSSVTFESCSRRTKGWNEMTAGSEWEAVGVALYGDSAHALTQGSRTAVTDSEVAQVARTPGSHERRGCESRQEQPRAHSAQPTAQQEQQHLFREVHLQSSPWQEPAQTPEPAVESPRPGYCTYASMDRGVQIAF
ncbi:hypothetical protein HJG60_007809 [Phyllostomus discolor]|uniref:Uncharacterized protein n=1 Tax=Phyllostomus discolor TaxID=89673 RepID=A0A834EVH4_9CHIR|nr:hypothetical protein HJG60_007809 [Phyllostomus discolor]